MSELGQIAPSAPKNDDHSAGIAERRPVSPNGCLFNTSQPKSRTSAKTIRKKPRLSDRRLGDLSVPALPQRSGRWCRVQCSASTHRHARENASNFSPSLRLGSRYFALHWNSEYRSPIDIRYLIFSASRAGPWRCRGPTFSWLYDAACYCKLTSSCSITIGARRIATGGASPHTGHTAYLRVPLHNWLWTLHLLSYEQPSIGDL